MLVAGASGYVLKPDTPQHLLATIRAVANDRTPARMRSPGSDLDRMALQAQGKLTRRELDVARLLAQGFTNAMVAVDLSISVKTVETHRAKIMDKLHLKNTADLVRYAIRNHIIDA